MTIPSTVRRAGPLLGTGAQTTWPFTFKVFAESDIAVTIADSDGVETPLTLGVDYSVALNANQETSPGGTVTYPISGSPLPVGSVLAIVGDLDYDQPLDLPSGGNFSPIALENQLDRATMQIQQLDEEMSRTAKLPVTSAEDADSLVADIVRLADSVDNIDTVAGSADAVDTVAADIANVNTVAAVSGAVAAAGAAIADVSTVAANIAAVNDVSTNMDDVTAAADFADVYQGAKAADPVLRNDGGALQAGDLYFNTVDQALRVYSGAQWKAGAAGEVTIRTFSGDGAETVFDLGIAPGDERVTQVYIGGIYQQKSTYSVSGTEMTFGTAPPLGTDNLEVVTISTLAIGETDASLVSYSPAGVGAVATDVQAKLREFVSVKDFGAVGDGVADDTAAIQAALATTRSVFLPAGTYKVSATLTVNMQSMRGENWLKTLITTTDAIKVIDVMSSGVVTDLQVTGVPTTVTGISMGLINRGHVSRCRVEQCGRGIELLDTQNSYIEEVQTQYNLINFYIDGAENCKFINCNGNLGVAASPVAPTLASRNIKVTNALHGTSRALLFLGGIMERGDLVNDYSVELLGTTITFINTEFQGGSAFTIKHAGSVTATYINCAWALNGTNGTIESDGTSSYSITGPEVISGSGGRVQATACKGGPQGVIVLVEHRFDYSVSGWLASSGGTLAHNATTRTLDASAPGGSTLQGIRRPYGTALSLDPDFYLGRHLVFEFIISAISTANPLNLYVELPGSPFRRLVGTLTNGYNRVVVAADVGDSTGWGITAGEVAAKTWKMHYCKVTLL